MSRACLAHIQQCDKEPFWLNSNAQTQRDRFLPLWLLAHDHPWSENSCWLQLSHDKIYSIHSFSLCLWSAHFPQDEINDGKWANMAHFSWRTVNRPCKRYATEPNSLPNDVALVSKARFVRPRLSRAHRKKLRAPSLWKTRPVIMVDLKTNPDRESKASFNNFENNYKFLIYCNWHSIVKVNQLWVASYS